MAISFIVTAGEEDTISIKGTSACTEFEPVFAAQSCSQVAKTPTWEIFFRWIAVVGKGREKKMKHGKIFCLAWKHREDCSLEKLKRKEKSLEKMVYTELSKHAYFSEKTHPFASL